MKCLLVHLAIVLPALAGCVSQPSADSEGSTGESARSLARPRSVGAVIFADPGTRDPVSVAAVLDGVLDEANAAWWGFDAEDATAPLQAAIDSGARRVLVPNMGVPWSVRPIELRGNQEIVFESGVVILAKKGSFLGRGDNLLHGADISNLTLRGYGASLRMHKADYVNDPYQPGEWRHAVSLSSVRNVRILGLRIESSGGDGIYLSGSRSGVREFSEDILIRDVQLLDHHRQGISVVSARNLLIERTVVSGTHGTMPQSGIDFEPNQPYQRLENCVVRESRFEDNAGAGVLIHLAKLDPSSRPVSIRFENCVVRGNTVQVMVNMAGGEPRGRVLFRRSDVGWPNLVGGREGFEASLRSR